MRLLIQTLISASRSKACGFLREVVDALVGNARVLALLAGHDLLAHEEEALEIGREFRQDAIFWVGADHRIDVVSCLDGEWQYVGFWSEKIRACKGEF